VKIIGNSEFSWAPLVGRRRRLTGCTGRPRDTVDGDHAPSMTTGRVRRPLPQDAPIISSLRPKSFCFPLLAVEHHTKPSASLLSTQRRAAVDEQLGRACAEAMDSSPASTPRRGGRPQGVGGAMPRAPEKLPPPQEAPHRQTTPPAVVCPQARLPKP
jgi:hypothetical protein